MKKIYPLFALGLLTGAVFFSSCSGTEETKTADPSTTAAAIDSNQAKPALKDFTYSFDNNEKRFPILSNRDEEIHLPSGTLIKIPASSFVDANGKTVHGKVDLAFEEFLTAGSIIASQINMKYDSAGTSSDFESAGMFRINAFQNGKELALANGKSLEVSLATVDKDKGFNMYYSTKDGNDWSYLGTSKATENTAKKDNATAIASQKSSIPEPIKPTPYSANGKYFDLNLSEAQLYNLKSLIGVVWEYAGKNKKEDPAQNKRAFNRSWDFVSILPAEVDVRGVYEIVLQNKDTTVKTQARPVYRGALLDAENKEFEKALGEFNTRMNQLRNQEKQSIAEASFLRTISIRKMGLYNYDRQYHMPDMIPVLANFNFGVDSLKNYPISVYLITGNGMAVVQYPPDNWELFRYSRKETNKLIAILPNMEICTFSNPRFVKEGPVFPAEKPGKFTFGLNHTGIKADNAAAIDAVLKTI